MHVHAFEQMLLYRSVYLIPGREVQLVTCLATDAYLTADSGVESSVPADPYFRGD